MRSREFTNMNEAYWPLFCEATLNGQRFEHRGDTCLELRPFSFSLSRPDQALYTGAPRRMNYRFWAAETLAYIAGWGEKEGEKLAQLLIKLNSNYVNFSYVMNDGSFRLNPMVRYGDGFGQGLLRAYNTLKENPARRQAYVSIWDRDTPHSYEESPCLIGAQFFTSRRLSGELELCSLFNIRSNDMNWGLPYDVAAFCAIQIAMAGALGLPVGRYHHVACSLHYYLGGGASKCGPPRISTPDKEAWIEDPPKMPRPPIDIKMSMLQTIAGFLLEDMHTHFICCGGKGMTFKSIRAEQFDWGKDWVDVIRWGWPK